MTTKKPCEECKVLEAEVRQKLIEIERIKLDAMKLQNRLAVIKAQADIYAL